MGDVREIADKISIDAVNAAISAFETSMRSGKGAAQAAAVACLTHTFQHREATTLARLMDLIKNGEGRDFVRLAPFTLWLVKFAPVKMVTVVDKDTGKKVRVLQFDKESKLLDNPAQTLADAANTLWWSLSREKEPTAFDRVNFNRRILGIARRALKDLGADANPADLAYVAQVLAQFEAQVASGAAVAKALAA